MDPILDQGTESMGMGLSRYARADLYEAARWGKFLSIVGFIGIGLIVLIGLGMGMFMSTMGGGLGGNSGMGMMMGGGVMMFLYVLIGALYFFPILYLYRFSTKARYALDNENQQEMDESFTNLKSMFKFMGILTIVMLSLYAIGILFAIVGLAL